MPWRNHWDASPSSTGPDPRPIHIIEHEDKKTTECGPNIEDPFAPKKNLGSGDWDLLASWMTGQFCVQ